MVPVIGVVWSTEFPYNTIQLCKHFTCNCRLGVLSHSCFKGVQFFSFRLLHQSFNSLRETGDFNNLLNHSFNKNIFPWLANLSNCVSKIHYHWQQLLWPSKISNCNATNHHFTLWNQELFECDLQFISMHLLLKKVRDCRLQLNPRKLIGQQQNWCIFITFKNSSNWILFPYLKTVLVLYRRRIQK